MSCSLLVLCLALCAAATVTAQKCTKEHPYVGVSRQLSTLEHDVNGTVVVKSDCKFDIENFTWDGKGPAVYVTAFSKKLRNGQPRKLSKTTLIMTLPAGDPYDGSTSLPVELPKGTTWDDIKVISIWCEAFAIDFGSTTMPRRQKKKARR